MVTRLAFTTEEARGYFRTNAVYVPEIEQATHKYSLSAKKGESI